MLEQLSGSTRVYFIVGDPIAQVKSPAGVTSAFEARGRNAVVVPALVAPARLASWLEGISSARNVDGVIITVPHKFAAHALCGSASDRAHFLQTVNVMRRSADGRWHGDLFDGLGFVAAMQDAGCEPAAKRALLAGAGGAGSAIAHALVMSGVGLLAIHDEDAERRGRLVARLDGLNGVQVRAGSPQPHGFDIVLNATPAGMKTTDAPPVDLAALAPRMHVGCVVTEPAVTPLVAAARARGCTVQTGADMFARVRDLMVDFLLAA